jgi:hypothetical protein
VTPHLPLSAESISGASGDVLPGLQTKQGLLARHLLTPHLTLSAESISGASGDVLPGLQTKQGLLARHLLTPHLPLSEESISGASGDVLPGLETAQDQPRQPQPSRGPFAGHPETIHPPSQSKVPSGASGISRLHS